MINRTHRPTAYLAGPDGTALAAALVALVAVGYLVTSATPADPVDAADLVAVVGDDMDAARAADVVVTLPGTEDSPEAVYAALFGVSVLTLAEALQVAR